MTKLLIRLFAGGDPQQASSRAKTGKLSGRGAYICKSEKCLETAFKKKQLDYAFKDKVEASVYENLREEFFKNGN